MTDQSIRNLACAIILQAVKDYFTKTEYKTEEKTEAMFIEKRKTILKDLRSHYMDMLSKGTSVIVAEQLELHPEDIAARLRQHGEIGGELI